MTALVLLHALPLDSSMWRAQVQDLGALGHRVLAVDQRGFGGRPLGDAAPSLDAVADDLAKTLDRENLDQVVLAGCSMGGYAVLAFLRRHPGRVRALALLSTRAEADTAQSAARRRAFAVAMRDPAARNRLVETTTPVLLGATSSSRNPSLPGELLLTAKSADPEAVAWAQEAIADRRDSLDVLRTTDVPALVVAGEEDELVSLAESQAAADALPHGRLVVLPEVGHLPPLEDPDTVTRLLAGLAEEGARP
ncbi:alpha/beta fold hydrolase [Streptomyces sp. NPDC004752]